MRSVSLKALGVLGLLAILVRCGSSPKPGSDALDPNASGATPDDPMLNLPGTGGSSTGPNIDPILNLGNGGAAGSGMCANMSCPVDPTATATCGNSIIEMGEVCDDGNSRPGDGCSGLCRVEANFACATPGVACVSTVVCGNGQVEASEACDDNNPAPGDGCDATCQVEPGFGCATPGQPCTPVTTAVCGDGVINAGETCDDGGSLSGDGCSMGCTLEQGYTCPQPGELCVLDEYCGNSRLSDTEGCDDGNTAPGDGCTGLCNLEPFYVCPTQGAPCQSTIVCGDSKVVGDEACDDGNTGAGDGCAADCKSTEPNFSCPTTAGVGGTCTPVAVASCGDSVLDFGEYCDDGNTNPSDGCTDKCEVSPGFTCPSAGQACSAIEWCGDGKVSLARNEQCDDGSKCDNGASCTSDAACVNIGGGKCLPRGSDGCSTVCVTEADFACPQPGSPCVSTVVCGDGKVTGNETCDDKNASVGDGCNNCQVEAGWECPLGGVCRAKQCGDGIVAGNEECDDMNNASPGCSAACLLENGYKCPTPGAACVPTVCGDAKKEGKEPCDDGNNVVGDGCNPFCQLEPDCSLGACQSKCGDGIKLPKDAEECDDGNNAAGDGCSATCKVEAGFTCTDSLSSLGNTLDVPVTFRDFIALPKNGGVRHPDFEEYAGDARTTGLVNATLGADGKPVYTGRCEVGSPNIGNEARCPYDEQTTNKAAFDQWYRDVPAVNMTYVQKLTLTRQPNGTYLFPDDTFFPLDGRGWVAQNKEDVYETHNFGFTSEIIYWFEYKGGEVLSFTGDDDVWVFINGKLAVDIGGLHGPDTQSVTLNATKAMQLGLTVGNVYEVVLFHAERHTFLSTFNLTLAGFVTAKSSCKSTCGDGIVTRDEACDLGKNGMGVSLNTGVYGTCNANCTLSPRCGDATVQTGNGEECDDGVNLATYGGTTKKCGPGCMWAPYCGDGAPGAGEQCDAGVNNQSGAAYGGCTTSCTLGPSCGDGVATNGEACDTGVLNGTSGSICQIDCKLKCGNGTLDAGEQCDDGTVNNIGGYGKCTSACLLGPRCGDGIKQQSEMCDDGKNDGSYGTCAPLCVLGPRCGDAALQSTAGELCDAGAQNMSSAYGNNLCTTACRPAPYCGNKAVDAAFGEKCDDGVNSGAPGSCSTDCKAAIPLASCGNGVKDGIEQCDAGASNGTAQSNCDARCRIKCGNGSVDSGEECDDGVNNGSYGTCTNTCKFAGYCGDGTTNGPEQCDKGANNQTDPYSAAKDINLCTKGCLIAPYCGDGRIQANHGEQCDSVPGCTPQCAWAILK
ncbi:MAG: DUF4215 domain-containing protein [Polyangiaceae bacterium]|nr:DUF4215 domain-containing protein [Polyangiaceae bacterium]